MKSVKFVLIALLSFQITCPIKNPITMLKQGGDWLTRNLKGYIEISEKHHPHTKQYIENLYKKYPNEFEDTSVYLFNTEGPAASFQSIYFPIYWAEKLEQEHQANKKDGLYTQATEWIILHEVGHIKNHDIANMAFAGFLAQVFSTMTGISRNDQFALQKLQLVDKTKTLAAVSSALVASIIYWAWQEYRADQYATEHCQSPEAVVAAYELLERMAPAGIAPGIMHSFKGFRLKRIAQAYEKKFGHPIPKSYHATDRVTA